jgi:hypothetical protein
MKINIVSLSLLLAASSFCYAAGDGGQGQFNSLGIGAGFDLAIQNANPLHPFDLSLKTGRTLENGLAGEGDLDLLGYSGQNTSSIDMRLLGMMKFIAGDAGVQPYLLGGLGFAFQWGTEGNGLALLSLDLATGAGVQFEFTKHNYIFVETKPSLLLRYQYQTAIDSPLTAGFIFGF